jgi:CRP-like cAMP-binding protein
MLHFTEQGSTLGVASARSVHNKILQSLPPRDFERLKPYLKVATFKRGELIHRANSTGQAVFFIESGLVARTAQTRNEAPFEVAMEGRSGALGLSLAFGGGVVFQQSTAITPITALKIDDGESARLLEEIPSLSGALLRHAHALTVQISHISLCSAKHSLESRVPRWLLMAAERLGADTIPITQETMAALLGVRRPGVTEALLRLQQGDIVAKSRGSIRIVDFTALASRSCVCHGLIHESHSRLERQLYPHIMT